MKQLTVILGVFLSMKCTLLSGQQLGMQVPVAPISLANDDNQKLAGMTESEIYFKYKTEKAFEGKIKKLMAEMIHDFDTKLSTALNIHSDTFKQEFDKVQQKLFDKSKQEGFPDGLIDSPKTIETLNKTWEDIIVLVAKVNEIVVNQTELHRYELEGYFFNDDQGQGHEKFSQQFLKVYNQFEADNYNYLKFELPKQSVIKQNKRIHKLTTKMINHVKKDTLEQFLTFEQSLIEQSKFLLDKILEEFVSSESHTNWKEQTRKFFDDMFEENKPEEIG